MSRFSANGDYGEVKALVKGFGKVAAARDGWRAQYAEVVAICKDSPYAWAYAQAYDVPRMTREEIDTAARNNTIPITLRPYRRAPVEKPVPVSIAAPFVSVPPRFSRYTHEVLWMLGFTWASVGALVAITFGGSPIIVMCCWFIIIFVLRAWWRFLP